MYVYLRLGSKSPGFRGQTEDLLINPIYNVRNLYDMYN